jgi:hypothetical protein
MDNKEPMKLVFTSFRDSMNLEGLKVSIDRTTPKMCSDPVLPYLLMPRVEKLSQENTERIVHSILDNNWDLIQDFVNEMYALGIRQVVLCDWATKEMISHGKACVAGMIGSYIATHKKYPIDGDGFAFPIEIEYRDGREVL